MDKGREAIRRDFGVDDFNHLFHILRAHGWRHLHDEVEGQRVPECLMQGGMCYDRQEDKTCTIGTFCNYQRPATVRDLIERKG